MGIVIRQSFWSSFWGYLGIGIGYLNAIILMPKYFLPEEIGLYRTILSSAALFAPIPLFGLRSAFIRFFPRNSDRQNGVFVILSVLVFLILFFLLVAIALIARPHLLTFFQENASTINDYLWLILVLIGLMGVYGLLESILKAKKDIITPSFFREFFYKLLQTGGVIMVGYSIINIDLFLKFQAYIYILIILALFPFAIKKLPVHVKIPAKEVGSRETKSFFTYAGYAFLSGLGTVAVLQVDQIMISKYIGLEANAIYTTAIFMAVVIELPRKFITQIVQPIMVEDFKANRLHKIHLDYKKASINQLIIGAYIFLAIAINLPNIYSVMPNGEIYAPGWIIVYIIGFAKLINMVFSLNGEIIVMSEYYRINILLILFLGIVTILMNLLLIPRFGIEGAAYASLITFFLFNFIKFIFIKVKFNFSPFSKYSAFTVLFIAIVILLNFYLPYLSNPYLDILCRIILLSALFFLFISIAKPSEEILGLLLQIERKLNLK